MEGLCECGCGRQTQVSKYTDARKGYVRGQHRRFLKGHHRGIPQAYELSDEGYGTPCHLWLGGVSGPYGWARATSSRRATFAHIAALLDSGRDVPAGMSVHHLCGVKMCVNPDHLVVSTFAEHRAMHPEARRPSKLTPEQIAEIRATKGPLYEIADRLGIHYAYAYKIRKGQSLSGL